ncbi:pantetheine-phosphate adenylyltransferase [Neorickettsia helminthoeca str. Oregon]|uniref:Phosphopantetheine adenylyltransferase n=1 Tax=Neorickettsia helminthoeca str. Oregon TaxID=1286528 RepID=X5H349_9RICK|nr:pantetheine-phosphate adenylyltransferase [Neorickettsia helminthoeca]AHX10981.1 pantetheine-phosphate adenylyltransferase [Neorickettsia helminthoeca str. Oregon]
MRIGVYAGTFDPVTLGHLDIIKRALLIVDKLIIGIAEKSSKNPTFSSIERLDFVTESISEISGNIEVKIFDGLLVNFMRNENCRIIIRGLRAVSDFEYEFQISWLNHKLAGDIMTIFLPASNETQFLSSTLVKQVATLNGDLSQLLPSQIINKVRKSICSK